jgi:hypothetical protein
MNLKKLVLIGVVVALAATSFGQGRGGFMRMMGGGSPAMMLQRQDVQSDLQLTDEQKTKLQEIQQNTMQAMQDARASAGDDRAAMRKAMEPIFKKAGDDAMAVLTADQQKRLKEINIQVNGNSALINNKELQDQIGLSEDQKAKVADLVTKQQTANGSIFQKVQSGEIQREDMGPLIQKNNQALKDEIGKVLTDDQKAKLKTAGGSKTFVPAEDNGGLTLRSFGL